VFLALARKIFFACAIFDITISLLVVEIIIISSPALARGRRLRGLRPLKPIRGHKPAVTLAFC